MANEVEELVISAKPEGIDETTDQLEDMSGQFDETADSMDDTAGSFEDLQNRWSGAMSAMVAGLAVAVGGLLTQVPILGELGGAVGAVLEAVGFQIDQLLRDLGAGGLIDAIFQFSNAIFEADGALGDFIGAISLVITTIAGAVGGYLAWIAATQGLAAAGAVLVGGLKIVGGAILTVVGAILSIKAAIIIAILAILAFAAAFIFNIAGVRDKTLSILGNLWDAAAKIIGNLVDDIVAFFDGLVSDVGEKIGELVDKARTWGENMFDNFIGALEGLGRAVAEIFLTGLNAIIDTINAAISKLPKEVRTRLGISTLSNINPGDIGLSNDGGGGFRANRNVTPTLQMDGRALVESDGRYRRDQLSRRSTDG